jgi:ankyrin repeat protein
VQSNKEKYMTTYNFDDLEPEDLIDELYDELEPDGDLDKIAALINIGCNIHQGMPLLPAVTSGNLAIVKLLVESGVNVNKFDVDDEETALFRALFNGHQHIVEYLEPLTDPDLRLAAREKLRFNPPHPPK